MATKRKRRELPKGRSWALSKAELRAALADHGAPDPSAVKTSNWATNGRVLGVTWNPILGPHSASWSGGPENVDVWIHDVASEERKAVQEAIFADALPELAGWLVSAASAPEGWKVLRHELEWSWVDGAIAVTKAHDGRLRHFRE